VNGVATPEVRTLRGRVMLGLCASLLCAAAGTYIGQFVPPMLYLPIWMVNMGMLVAASIIRRRIIGWTFVFAFTLISGMTITPILEVYTQMLGFRLVEEAFFVTAGAFAGSALIATRPNVDFGWMGTFLFSGLITLILFGLVSIFLPLGGLAAYAYTYCGIALFVGFMLFDLNRISRHGLAAEQVPRVVLSLYLDFINLFLFILRLFGLNVQSRN
jgi:FtsH-binding integral membrane protein